LFIFVSSALYFLYFFEKNRGEAKRSRGSLELKRKRGKWKNHAQQLSVAQRSEAA
jgi:hypothetical protein